MLPDKTFDFQILMLVENEASDITVNRDERSFHRLSTKKGVKNDSMMFTIMSDELTVKTKGMAISIFLEEIKDC